MIAPCCRVLIGTLILVGSSSAAWALESIVDLAPLGLTGGVLPVVPYCAVEMVMTSVPAQPRSFVAQVHGRQVTLSWVDPGNVTHFDIEAGSAPGLGNRLRQSIGGTTLTVSDVPPGVYYLGLRAINYVGRSLPAEITVVVP
jgi:hypothetical protein